MVKRRVSSRDPQNQNRDNDNRHPGIPRNHYDWLDGSFPTIEGSSSSRGGAVGGTRNPYGVDLDIPTGSDNPVGEPFGKTNQEEFDPNNPWDWIRATYGADKGNASAWLANAFNAAQVLQQMQFQNEQSNVAWNRQLYSEDRAYERTKFETLFNQYLAAGMSPIAALQAAAQGSPDVSGSSPSPAAGGVSAGNVNPDPYAASRLALGAFQSVGSSVLSAIQMFAQLKENKRQFDLSYAENQRQFDVTHFDELAFFKGSSAFYNETAPLFLTRDEFGHSPLAFFTNKDFDAQQPPVELGEFFPDLLESIKSHAGDPYYDAAYRHFMESQIGHRGFAYAQSQLGLQNRFLEARNYAQDISNRLANFSLLEYNSMLYGVLTSCIANDSSFRDSYGIYYDGDDYVFPEVTLKNGDVLSDVSLTDYIKYMSDGHIDNMSLQGLSYLDVLSHLAEFQSLTLQTDLDLFNSNLSTMRNNAKTDMFYSALDLIVSQANYNTLKDSKTFDTLTAWKTYLDRTGVGNAAKMTADYGIKLYGIRKGNLPNANMDFEEHMSSDGKGNVSKYRVYK